MIKFYKYAILWIYLNQKFFLSPWRRPESPGSDDRKLSGILMQSLVIYSITDIIYPLNIEITCLLWLNWLLYCIKTNPVSTKPQTTLYQNTAWKIQTLGFFIFYDFLFAFSGLQIVRQAWIIKCVLLALNRNQGHQHRVVNHFLIQNCNGTDINVFWYHPKYKYQFHQRLRSQLKYFQNMNKGLRIAKIIKWWQNLSCDVRPQSCQRPTVSQRRL